MKTVLHGPLPAGVKDHGVFDATPTTSAPEYVKALLARLRADAEQAEVKLSPVLERVKAGTATPEEVNRVPEMAANLRRLKDAIKAKQIEVEQVEAEAAERLSTNRRQRFTEVVIEAREQREAFFQLFEETCKALGSFCVSIDEAQTLANQLGTRQVGDHVLTLPEYRAAVTDLTKDLNPLAAIRDCRPRTGFGWNLTIAVAPLEPSGGKQQ